jgi:hypothetical protein
MKNCTNIEQDVPDSIPEALGADSGAKRPKHQKNVTRKISETIGKKPKTVRELCAVVVIMIMIMVRVMIVIMMVIMIITMIIMHHAVHSINSHLKLTAIALGY